MAWWRPEEEPSPQERIGAGARVGATSRPVDEETRQPDHTPRPQQAWTPPSAPRWRPRGSLPFSLPIAIVALVFVALFVLPFVLVFRSFDGDGGGFSGVESHDGPSLVPRERFARAWEKVLAESGSEASLGLLRVAPDRIDAIVNQPGGSRVNIQVRADLSVMQLPAGSDSNRGLSLRRFDTALPERLVRRAAERVGASRDDLSYLALSVTRSFGSGGVWSIFFGGRFVIADYDGSNMRVPGQ